MKISLSTIISIVAMAISFVTLIFVWRATNIARKTLITPLINNLYDAYHTDYMINSIKNLQRWWKTHGNDFANAFAKEKNDHLAKDEELNDLLLYRNWRHAKDYFLKCKRFDKAGILKDDDVKILMTSRQAALFLQIIEPMGIAADPEFDRDIGYMLLKIFPDAKDSKHLIDLAPAAL